MKVLSFAFAVCLVLRSAVALASGGASVLLHENGDVEIENVGDGCAARRAVIELNTNADCRVVCQVYYRDNGDPLSADIDEIDRKDRIVNVLLATYMGGACWGLSPDELVEAYRSGVVFEGLTGFPEWAAKALDLIYDPEDPDRVDLSVIAVSMRAVGEFGVLVAE